MNFGITNAIFACEVSNKIKICMQGNCSCLKHLKNKDLKVDANFVFDCISICNKKFTSNFGFKT